VVGYDLISSRAFGWVHHGDSRAMRIDELRAVVSTLPVDQAVITPSLAGLTVRFLLRRAQRP
jgi:hypothetical protein